MGTSTPKVSNNLGIQGLWNLLKRPSMTISYIEVMKIT